MIIQKRFIIWLFAFLAWGHLSYAQVDTIRELESVEIRGTRHSGTVRVGAPVQVMSAERLEHLGVEHLSDAVKRFSGVTVRDYGGAGGMKTVSVRGLGSQFSGVALDGIAVWDCQSGQVDLGRYSLDNAMYVSLSNGQASDLLMSARAYAAANVLNVESKSPVFASGKPVNAKAGIELGSFGYWKPSVSLESQLSRKATMSLNISHAQSKGDYPFTIYYGEDGDSTSTERRENADVKITNADLGFLYRINNRQTLKVKANTYLSERGLPGAVIFYTRKASERLWDKTFFAQAHYMNAISDKLQFHLRTKYNYAYTHYLDTMVLNTAGKTDNEYFQREYYLSGTLGYQPFEKVMLSYASDFFVNRLSSNLNNNTNPYRNNAMNVLSARYEEKRLIVSGSLLSTYIQEYSNGEKYKTYNQWTPFASVLYKILRNENLYVRYFYKESYRPPSFGELYFYSEPNPHLTSEKANQHNAGLSFIKEFPRLKTLLTTTADGYRNRVQDKIVAIPKNLFVWSVYNIGEVETWGIDVSLGADMTFSEDNSFNLSGNYSLQHSTDRTDEDSKTYGHQIPYVPKHSGGYSGTFKTRWLYITYSTQVSGKRYRAKQNTETNELPAYAEYHLLLGKDFWYKKMGFRTCFQVLNIFDKQYEIVKNYPMQGRNFKISLEITY